MADTTRATSRGRADVLRIVRAAGQRHGGIVVDGRWIRGSARDASPRRGVVRGERDSDAVVARAGSPAT
jgi:hypothetical protein